MNNRQALALAVLQDPGDDAAVLALADLVKEDYEARREDVEARLSAWKDGSSSIPGIELYAAPEFRALCKLLNIAWELPTTDIRIVVPVDGLVVVEHNYQCRRRRT